MRSDARFWLLFGGTVLLGATARAANPPVSLRVQTVTVTEACRRLQEAAHTPIVPPAGDNLQDRASFDWTDTTLADALRQICEHYHLRPARRAEGGFMLHPIFQAAAAPVKPVGLLNRGGTRLQAAGVAYYENRSQSFHPSIPGFNSSSLNVSLSVVLQHGDAESIAGIENAVARDDLGNILTAPAAPNYNYSYSGGTFPDEWIRSTQFSLPNTKARRLHWLEGDLMVFRSVKALHAEIALPLSGAVSTARAGAAMFVVSRYRVIPKPARENDELDVIAAPANFPPDWGPTVRIRVVTPSDRVYRPTDSGYDLFPVAIGKSGRQYRGTLTRGGGSSSAGDQTVRDGLYLFPAVDEELVRLTWDVTEKARPEKLFSFRLTEIPLPAPQPPVPAPVARIAKDPAGPAAPSRPFYQKEGAVLLHTIRVAGKAAPEGMLRVGLSEKTAAGWGPIRWLEVPVASDGQARLENLRPGVYRMLRTYMPRTAAPGSATLRGRWTNSDTQLQVTGAKELPVPALSWDPEPIPQPSAGATARKRTGAGR